MPPEKRRGDFHSDSEREGDDEGDLESNEGEQRRSSPQSSGRKRRRISDETASSEQSNHDDDNDDDEEGGGGGGGEDASVSASTPPSDFETDDEEGLIDAASQAARKRYSERGDISNEPANHGILEKVELVNFMCHKHYEYKLGPLINFICGKNGSGKSAILTAIVLCLGGKAAATNRGSSLKDFIRQGSDHARIVCHIKNQGESAYQPELYGDSILVERHFSRSGPSGFKIKSINGKLITSKRADLEDICDHFTLQIENPLNVLSQDQARQFITTSSPAEKYKFFVKGVLLEQLDQDYRLIEEQLDNIQPKIDAAAPDIKFLEQRWQTADSRLKETRSQDKLRAKIADLRRQCTWVQIRDQEVVLAGIDETVAAQEETLAQAERDFDEFRQTFDLSDQLATDAKDAKDKAETDRKALESEKAEAAEPQDSAKKDVADALTQMRNAKINATSNTKLVESKKREIEKEEARLAEVDGGGAARRRQELSDAQEAVKVAKKAQSDHAELKPGLDQDYAQAMEDEKKALDAKRQKEADVRRQEGRLNDIRKNHEVQDTVYHLSMPQILADIGRETRFQQRPIGPIGKNIKLLAPEWSSILEKSFGGSLNGFIVFSKQDERLLGSILGKYRGRGPGNNSIQIFLGNDKRLDTTGREPEDRFQTVMRAIEIDNEHVRKVLIIAHSIENTGLIANQTEASRVLFQERPSNMTKCYSFHPRDKTKGLFLSIRGGKPAQDPVAQWEGKTRMKTNIDAQIRIQEEVVQDAKTHLRELENTFRIVQAQRVAAGHALERHKRLTRDLKIATQQAEDAVERLEGEIEENTANQGNLEVLQEALRDAESNVATLEGIYMDAVNNSDLKKEALSELTAKLTEFDKRLAALKVIEEDAKRNARRLDDKRVTDLRHLNNLESIKKDSADDLRQLEAKRKEQSSRIDDWTKQAEETCPRVNVPESTTRESLDEQHAVLKRREEASRKATGDPKIVEAAAAEALDAYEKAKTDLQSLEELQEALKDSLLDRKRRWKHFRGHISAAARSQFTYFLSERGFRGEVVLDHRQKLLDIRVEPDITRRDGAGRSARTLSGGEKSFSQICLLLSIWEAMGSPIRCLDEFDVFMDAVNRSTSVSLLIEAARQSPGKQYILISPGTKSDIKKAADVHTIEIAPPERGQARLDFGASVAAAA